MNNLNFVVSKSLNPTNYFKIFVEVF